MPVDRSIANPFVAGGDIPQIVNYLDQRKQQGTENALRERQLAGVEGQVAFNQNRLIQQDQMQQRAAEEAAAAAKKQEAMAWGKNAYEVGKLHPERLPGIVATGKRLGYFDDEMPDNLTPEQLDMIAAHVGIIPPLSAEEQFRNSPKFFENEQDFTNKRKLEYTKEAIAKRSASQPDVPYVRPLSAGEIRERGLPPGTSAEIDTRTGKTTVLSKRDSTSSLSQKDATRAKEKLNAVAIAREQLALVRQNFDALKNTTSAGPFGQGLLPTPSGDKFDKAVDSMRASITALTRVPGVGAMSDFETKLDQAKMPTRNAYEESTAQQIASLEQLLSGVERGYSDMLGNEIPQASDSTASNDGWSVRKK